MSRYFFHLDDGELISDPEGVELASLANAKKEAVRFGGELLSLHSASFLKTGDWVVRVTDERGVTVFTMELVVTSQSLYAA